MTRHVGQVCTHPLNCLVSARWAEIVPRSFSTVDGDRRTADITGLIADKVKDQRTDLLGLYGAVEGYLPAPRLRCGVSGVLTEPGWAEFTRVPWRPRSIAEVFVGPWTPHSEAE